MTATDLEDFLRRFSVHRQGLQQRRVEDFTRRFEALREAWAPIDRKWSDFKKANAPELNIFRILGVEHDEVRTHSRMLRWLWDPQASHAQGSFFLDGFLVDRLGVPATSGTDWRSRTEVPVPTGKIDLVLSSAAERRLIVIENKIYALEQARQLERYAEWMSVRERWFDRHQMQLVFLTLDGHPSLTAGGNEYRRLAYRPEIVDWLSAANKSVRPANLRAVIQQYIETIRRL